MSYGSIQPHKVGFLDEALFPSDEIRDETAVRVLKFRFDEAYEAGLIDRPVEVVVAKGQGLPTGSADLIEGAWMELHDAGVLAIIGPGITDNCIAVKRLFEKHRLATVNFPGTVKSRGKFGFHYQIGALYEDGPIAARAIAAAGMKTVAVIRDRSPIGQEFFEYFVDQCELSGLAVKADLLCSPIETDFTALVAEAKAGGAESLVYLGYGGVLVDLSRALRAASWDPPRFTVSAGMHWYSKSPEERAILSGWVYVDQVDEDNPTLNHLVEQARKRWDVDAFSPLMGGMYDMATLVAYGLHYAPVLTRHGVMEGLERVHHLPSALGAAGTVQGFGPDERTALKGEHYLVLRQMEADRTVRYRG